MSETSSQDVNSLEPEPILSDEKRIWRRLRRNISIAAVGSGASVAIKLGQAVLLTRFLKIDDYGRILIVTNLFVFLDSFLGLRVSDVIFRFFQPLKEKGDPRAVRSLVLLCLGICLTSGLLIYFGILVSSAWLAEHLYSDSRLSPLFNIYGFTLLVASFSGVYEPILRIYDRFSAIILPQLLGSLVTFGIFFGYFATIRGGEYDLRVIVVAFVIGLLIQSIPPLIKTLHLVRPFFASDKNTKPLVSHRIELVRCLFNSNLSGYLKFAINPGDIFLLGLFSSPTQVALYGLAKQITAPLALLQTTIQTAVTPEITMLRAKNQYKQIQAFLARYLMAAIKFGGLLALIGLVAGRLLFLFLFASQYSTALPVFYCLLTAAWLLLVLLLFRPLAVSLDLLKWHNLALMFSVFVLSVLVVTHRLDAMTMAFVQLAEAALLRPAFSVLVWNRLRNMIE